MFMYALLLVLPILIIAAPPANLEDDLFKGLDEDGDGKISNAEAEGYFLGYDENKDGIISQLEFTDSIDKVDPAFSGHEKALFDLLDHNSDGQVTKGDLDAVFKLVDTNGDNDIDKHEFSTAFAAVVNQVG